MPSISSLTLLGAAGCALSLAATTPVLAAGTILPGYWESQNKVSFPLAEESTSRECITPQKVEQFLSGPSTKHVQCTYSRSHIAGGKVDAVGDCVDKKGMKATIAVKGVYTPTTFTLDAQLGVNIGGLALPINASTQARRISEDCPPPE